MAIASEYALERSFREVKLHRILEGSAIQKMIIANDPLGYQKANR